MGKIRKILAAIMVSTMAMSMAGCKMIAKTPEAIQKTVLAKVGDEKIVLSDVDVELKAPIDSLKSTYGEDYESKIDDATKKQLVEARKQVLEQLVTEKVLLNKAKELNLVPNKEELDKKVADKTQELISYYGDEEKFNSAKESYGYTDETFKTFMENQIIAEIVREDIIKDISVSDKDVEEYYNKNIDTYTTKPSATVKHILFEDEDSAKASKAAIDAGTTTFDEEFEKYKENKANNVKPLSEDLGVVAYDQQNFDKDFLEGLKTVGEGQVSNPVKSSFGYHLINATNVVSEAVVKPLDEVKDDVRTAVETKKKSDEYNETLEKWKKELNVKIYEDKLK